MADLDESYEVVYAETDLLNCSNLSDTASLEKSLLNSSLVDIDDLVKGVLTFTPKFGTEVLLPCEPQFKNKIVRE